MKRVQIMVCTLLLLVSVTALLPAVSNSTNSTLEVISYDDEGIERSLAGVECKSKVTVECVLANTGVPCTGNLKVKRSACKNKPKQPQKIEITWKYCNPNTALMQIDQSKTVAIYKKNAQEDNVATVGPKRCRVITRKPSINLCKSGATMSIKAVGNIPSRQNSYCYAYKFLRVRVEKLKGSACSVSTEVTCLINDKGENQGEACSGNIINKESCGDVEVKFVYTICVFNRDAQSLKMNSKKSRAQLNGVDMSLNTKKMGTKKACRRDVRNAVINSCSMKDTNASLRLRGVLNTGKKCRSTSYLKVRAAEPCAYDFIITELVSDGINSYIEIYSPTCRNEIVAQDFQIVRYKPGDKKPSQDTPINLKGLETNVDGFIIVCASRQGNIIQSGANCTDVNQITATLTGKDTIAIVSGAVDDEFSLVDVFGYIPNAEDKNAHHFRGGLAVRKENVTAQSAEFEIKNWEIYTIVDGDITPGSWFNIGNDGGAREIPTVPPAAAPAANPSNSPTNNPSASTNPSNSVTNTPLAAPAANPSNSPTNNPSKNPSNSVTNTPSAQPSICDTQPYIAEVVLIQGAVDFIELRAKSICAYNMTIEEPTELIFNPVNGGPQVIIDIQGKKYNPEGFLVFCSESSLNDATKCNGGDYPDLGNGGFKLKTTNDTYEYTFECEGAETSCRRYRSDDSSTDYTIGVGPGSPGSENSTELPCLEPSPTNTNPPSESPSPSSTKSSKSKKCSKSAKSKSPSSIHTETSTEPPSMKPVTRRG